MPKTLKSLQIPIDSVVKRAPDRQTFYSQHYQIKFEVIPGTEVTIILSQEALNSLQQKNLISPFLGVHSPSQASKMTF